MAATTVLKVGFVPEHFSTPLQFAQIYQMYEKHGVKVELIPYLAGSGHLIQSLGDGSIDIAVGLTEAFIRGIANGEESYRLVGTYVDSPLRWAVSSGASRSDIIKVSDLQNKRIGVSRIGSGSYVMSFVLGLQQEFKAPFYEKFPICSTFKNLRDSVNLKSEDPSMNSDAFMWEYFTSKKYYDSGEIKMIGEIYTPWPSWVINARTGVDQGAIDQFMNAVNEGVEYFNQHPQEAIKWIYTNLDYSEEDASEWIKTVSFSKDVTVIDWDKVVVNTKKVLQTAEVLKDDDEVIESRLMKFVVKK
ncbi:hypothetical protein DASC09_026400 [Saccharomycopsis crataegensis]|uniref:Ca3427-like PBP 2 domain-containing protein n=1 Tax=Saccharomycopsis crataegensis TaxID=43959 RepID=A0AAV5QLU6_9ASCO|nr:hypothetical protein DASC09_026400 [Saccharomycopsis crataegensis]